MRSLCLASLLLFVLLPLYGAQDHPQTKSANDKAAQTRAKGEQNSPPQPQSSTPDRTTKAGDEQNKTDEEAHPWLTHGEWVMSILTFVYVSFTGVYVVISHKTLKEIEKQAERTETEAVARDKQFSEQLKVSREAADAASNYSKALLNAERPWLFIEISVTTGDYPLSIIGGAPEIPEGFNLPGIPSHLNFRISFRNYGDTPAEVVGVDYKTQCVDDIDKLPWPPEYANQGNVMVHTRIVPPRKQWQYPGPGAGSIWVEEYLLADQWEDIRRSNKRLIHWGRVQYRDLIEESKTFHEAQKVGTIHETGFCYFWSPRLNDFLICGPIGYNKHT